MATFAVRFEGLICHVGPDEFTKTHAAIVHEPIGHRPAIVIARADLVSPGLSPDPKVIRLGRANTVHFEGLDKGSPTTTSRFRNRVARITEVISNGDLHEPVKRGRDHSHVVARVFYGAGTLDAPQTHHHPIRFTLDNVDRTQCVATYVDYESTTANASVEVIVRQNNGQIIERVVVNSDASIAIVNISASGNHFGEYQHLTSTTAIARAEEDTTQTCRGTTALTGSDSFKAELERTRPRASGAVKRMAINHPECTNSTYP